MDTAGTKNLTAGNSKRLIVEFAVPIFISQLFQQLYNAADSVIVGNYLGKNSLAAVSSSGTLIYLIISFFSGIAAGAGVVISRYFGAKDYENVSKAVHTDLLFGLICGVIITIFGVTATPTLLKWMGTDKTVLPESIVYFRYYFLGVIGTVMYNLMTGIMNAVGDSKRPLYYLIFSSVLNVGLDLLFIGKFGLGVGAAAAATVIAQVIAAVLCLLHLMKKGTVYQVSLRKIRLHKTMLGQMVRFGLPTGVQNSVIGFANVIVQSNINSFGPDAMAGYGAYIKIEGFAFLPITCFSMALSTFVSQNLGAGKHARAKEGAKFGIITSLILAETIGVLIFVLAPFLIGLFNTDPLVVQYGVTQARVEALFCFLLAFAHIIAGILRGAGKSAVPMIIMLAVWCVVRISYITIAMQINHEIRLIYMAYPITWGISSVIFLVYYLKSNWVHGLDRVH